MRKLEVLTIVAFFLILAGFPITQALYEALSQGEQPYVLTLFSRVPTKVNLHGWDNTAKDKSIFAKHIRPAMMQWRYDLFGDMGHKALKGVEDWLFYTPDVEYVLQPPYRDARFYKGSLDTVIGEKSVNLRNPMVAILDFRDRLRERGIELLVVPVPGKPSIYPEKLSAKLTIPPPSPTWALLEEMRQSGLHVVDLYTPLLKAKGKEKEDLYLRRDTHWTPRGLAIAAAHIAQAAQKLVGELPPPPEPEPAQPMLVSVESSQAQEAALPAATSPQYVLETVEVERWGDIAEMTRLPKRKSIWKMERVPAHRVMQRTRADSLEPYKDSEDSPILYLGDSFSRIYQTDAPKNAGVIAHIAYNLGYPLSSIVNDGGASTIVRQQMLRKAKLLKGKKLVIWEFVERDIRFGAQGWKLEELPPEI